MPPELAAARRTSPLSALFWVFRGEQLRNLLPVVVIGASSGRLVLVVLGVVVIGGLYGMAAWWRRTWSFTDGVLHLDDGVLVRNQRRIPVERIQHVELERRLRHQLFGLAGVRIETAGGSGAELHLDAVTRAEAEAIRSTVLTLLREEAPAPAPQDGHLPPPPPPPPPEVLVRLPPSRLLLAGVTGPEVLAVLAAITVGLDFVTDLGVDPADVDAVDASAAVLAALAVLVLPLWFAVAALIGLVRRWDLTATIVGDELRVTYGLLRRNEFVVKTARVQDVRIAHRLLLRPFGRADVRVRTAASGSGDQSRVDIPLLSDAEIAVVLARVLPAAVPLPALAPAPPGARIRSLFRSTVLAAIVAVVAGLLALRSPVPVLAVGAVLLVPLGAAWGEAAYRGLGHARAREVVHSRSGALTRLRVLVPEPRIQSGATVTSWFQRRRHLAHVRLDLAGGRVTVLDRDATDATRILATATHPHEPFRAAGSSAD